MGSTGASIAAATVVFGTMEGVDRGALGGPIVGYAPKTVIIDLGTNVDTRPQQLLDFAALGSVMSRLLYGSDNPRVAILSVGSEEGKGNRQVRETSELLHSSSLNFIGNLEPGDLTGDNAEVVLCDGFVGNMVLKLTEALGQSIVSDIEAAVGQTESGAELASEVFLTKPTYWRLMEGGRCLESTVLLSLDTGGRSPRLSPTPLARRQS